MQEPQNPTSPSSTGAAQTGQNTGGAGSPSPGAQDTGFRYTAGPGIPDYIVGKTPQQVAQEYSQLYEFALKSVGQPNAGQVAYGPASPPTGYRAPEPQYQTPYASAPPGPAVPQGPQPPTPEEWQMDPAGAYQKQRDFDEATRYQPVIGGLQGQLAETNMALLRRDFPEEFKKYGPEIIQLANTVPPQNRTYDALHRCVQVVRSNHVDDLVEERMQQRLANAATDNPNLRPGAAPTTGMPADNSLDFNELPEGYRQYLEINRVDQGTLDEFLMGAAGSLYGSSLNERRKGFIEAAKGGDVRTERPIQSEGGMPSADQTKLQISEA